VYALHQLQDGVYLHPGREETKSSERVTWTNWRRTRIPAKLLTRAKYIEGLENRLGRMESLLKLSGLLSDEDNLGTLEKRLADKAVHNGDTPSRTSNRSGSANAPRASTESHHNTPTLGINSSPRSSMASPESRRAGEEEVEALSDMMCSLVTNNCGETRYIGWSDPRFSIIVS